MYGHLPRNSFPCAAVTKLPPRAVRGVCGSDGADARARTGLAQLCRTGVTSPQHVPARRRQCHQMPVFYTANACRNFSLWPLAATEGGGAVAKSGNVSGRVQCQNKTPRRVRGTHRRQQARGVKWPQFDTCRLWQCKLALCTHAGCTQTLPRRAHCSVAPAQSVKQVRSSRP